VKQQLCCALEEKAISRSEIVKGYEYAKDQYVTITEDELRQIEPATARKIEILQFVNGRNIDPVIQQSSYYVLPGDAAGERAYALLFKAMRDSELVGVAKIAMHSREYVVIVRPGEHGILLHTMYYADEVRAVDEFRTDLSAVDAAELQMAQKLMRRMRGPFEHEKYVDGYRVGVMALVQSKVDGVEMPKSAESTPVARVIDIAEALRKSLAGKESDTRGGAQDGSQRLPENPHTNAHRSVSTDIGGLQAGGRGKSASGAARSTTGDPSSSDAARGGRPQRSSRASAATPKRSVSGAKKRA
jgi:DNA end-binding protein Ku